MLILNDLELNSVALCFKFTSFILSQGVGFGVLDSVWCKTLGGISVREVLDFIIASWNDFGGISSVLNHLFSVAW